jgi:hypothetical protein
MDSTRFWSAARISAWDGVGFPCTSASVGSTDRAGERSSSSLTSRRWVCAPDFRGHVRWCQKKTEFTFLFPKTR